MAIAVVALSWSAAFYIHERTVFAGVACACRLGGPFPAIYSHPSWDDPVAVLLAVGGLAVAVGIVATGRESLQTLLVGGCV